jgi:regulator of replication initiation timing
MEEMIVQALNGSLPEPPPEAIGEVTIEDLIATIGELEVNRRVMLAAINRLRVENGALKARIAHLEAEPADPDLEE